MNASNYRQPIQSGRTRMMEHKVSRASTWRVLFLVGPCVFLKREEGKGAHHSSPIISVREMTLVTGYRHSPFFSSALSSRSALNRPHFVPRDSMALSPGVRYALIKRLEWLDRRRNTSLETIRRRRGRKQAHLSAVMP